MIEKQNQINQFNNKDCKNLIIVASVTVLAAIITIILSCSIHKSNQRLRNFHNNNQRIDTSKLGLSMEELEKRTDPKYLSTIHLLKTNAPEYNSLAQGDKDALKHLVKAAMYLENIEYQIDDQYNLPFKKYLEDEIKKNNTQAKLTKILFDAQKGINAVDRLSQEIYLAKGHKTKPGIGVYPEDLTEEEYHNILIKMLKEKKIEEVKNITNQRSIVIRDGEYLKSIDYIDYFKDDFNKIANELDEAAKTSTNKDFTEYLNLQSKALRTPDPILDAYADIKWAELQNTPLELTLIRENYEDEITGSYVKNEELTKLLKENNIVPVPKDCLGLRVGIINKEGTDNIIKIKDYLPILANNMPYKDEYSHQNSSEEIKQAIVDVDLVILAGVSGAYRGGVVLAENLPNDDKLSLKMGGGRRNVYHRQIRFSGGSNIQKTLDEILDPEQHKYYDIEANHWFVIGHENCHSLGPTNPDNKLGEYRNIIEENKADICSLAFTNLLKNESYYTEEQRIKIIVTTVVDLFLKVKPDKSQAHRVRTVMQNYYFYQKGVYNLTKDDKIHVNIDKVPDAAYSMLEEIIRVQIDNDFKKGEQYVNRYFVWTDEMTKIGNKLQKIISDLNGKIENELADKLLEEK